MNLIVHAEGYAEWKGRRLRCALGRAGISADKREGDGATPVGVFPFREIFFRADRLARPASLIPARPLAENDGWCDDPADAHYNRHITLPYPSSHERLVRDDGLYDVIVVLGHNDAPVVPGRGSAIFLHVAAPGFAPTEGCIALARDDLLAVLADCRPGDGVEVLAG
jgi:L,D-peptidoglycan transpeptidase YkuD (ErfK/YbiS/YcfS/YnhG family)